MKKVTKVCLVLALMFVTMGDDCEDSPQKVGFSVAAVRRFSNGFERPVAYAVTNGEWQVDGATASGQTRGFYDQASASGLLFVEDGRAPALWDFLAAANWEGCQGQSVILPVERNKYVYLVCLQFRFMFPPLPATIDSGAPPSDLTIYTDGSVDTTHGMPVLQFYNMYGTLTAQTQVTSVAPDGTWVKAPAGCLSGVPVGDYTVKVYNAAAGGAVSWLGDSSIYVYGGWLQNPIDDRSFFVRQLYLDMLNREPDDSGWTGWTNNIEQCGNDTACANARRIEVTRGIMESDEFRQRIGGAFNPAYPGPGDTAYNREYVRQCYVVFLGREPGGGEEAGWLNYLFNSGDYNGVIDGFINSGEYRSRFMPEPGIAPVCDPPETAVQDCNGSGGSWNWDTCSCDGGYIILQ